MQISLEAIEANPFSKMLMSKFCMQKAVPSSSFPLQIALLFRL